MRSPRGIASIETSSLQNLLSVEVEEVAAKIDALEGIRRRLESSLMRLQEEELELEDERKFHWRRFFQISNHDLCL